MEGRLCIAVSASSNVQSTIFESKESEEIKLVLDTHVKGCMVCWDVSKGDVEHQKHTLTLNM